MERNMQKLFSIFIFLVLTLGLVLFLFQIPNHSCALLLYVPFAALVVHQYVMHYTTGYHEIRTRIFLLAELGLAIPLQVMDTTDYQGFYYIILIGIALLCCKNNFAIPYVIFSLFIFSFITFYRLHFIPALLFRESRNYILPRVISVMAIIVARYSINVGNENKRYADLLQAKTVELEKAMEDLKETAYLRAKEKFMYELHDQLGHTLMTASIGVQTAQILIDQEPDVAKDRLGAVTLQIQASMQLLRNVIAEKISVHYDNSTNFTQTLLSFIEETERDTGTHIYHNLADTVCPDNLPQPLQSFLANALMEGITNGIEHGEASEFNFSLEVTDRAILFSLQDNGKGFQKITYGYGLCKMKQDADKLHAKLTVTGQNGCLLQISLPLNPPNKAEG